MHKAEKPHHPGEWKWNLEEKVKLKENWGGWIRKTTVARSLHWRKKNTNQSIKERSKQVKVKDKGTEYNEFLLGDDLHLSRKANFAFPHPPQCLIFIHKVRGQQSFLWFQQLVVSNSDFTNQDFWPAGDYFLFCPHTPAPAVACCHFLLL